ncbi:MAG: hypothetical protein ABW061_29650 [Polyangiaceae bacterium]
MLASCAGELDRPPVTPAATVIDSPESCVSLAQLRETRVRDDWTIDFIAESGRVWRNTLPSRCSGLKVGNSFSYETSLSQLCNTDIIYVLEPAVDLHRGPACGLGEFVPVKLQK